MKNYRIEVFEDGKWKQFLHWHSLQKSYGLGAFRMLTGFNTGKRYRYVSSEDEVLEERTTPGNLQL